MKNLWKAAALAIVLASCGNGGSVQVLHVNSLRGQIQPTEKDGVYSAGFSLLSAALRELRSRAGNAPVYTVAVYNAFHGTPEAHFTEGRAIVDLMNDAGFDALVVGPREFYFGLPALERLAAAARFPFLAANIRRADGAGLPWLKPYLWDPKRRVGLVGLAPRTVLSQNLAENVAGLEVTDEAAAAAAAVEELRELGARTIGLFAGGLAWGSPAGSADAMAMEALLALDGIDQYWFGSASADLPDGLTVVERDGGARVVTAQSGARFTNGRMVARTVIAASPEGASFEAFTVDSSAYLPDSSLADRIYGIEAAVAGVMDTRVAEAASALDLEFERECSMGNLLADVFRERAGTQVFLLNSGKIRAAFAAGPITRKQVYDTLPFGGNIVTTELTGEQLLRILNRGCTFVGNPKAGRGFLQVSGVSFSWDPARPPMDQVIASTVKVGGVPLARDRRYSLGTEAYIFGGGDGYADFGQMGLARTGYDETSILTVLESALAGMGTVDARVEGRVTVLASGGN